MALLGRNSRGFGYAGLQDNESTRLLLRKTTSQQDYETTSGAVAGIMESRSHGIMELRIYGFTESRIGRSGSKLKAFLYSLYSLYFLYPFILSILTAHDSFVCEA